MNCTTNRAAYDWRLSMPRRNADAESVAVNTLGAAAAGGGVAAVAAVERPIVVDSDDAVGGIAVD